MRPTYSSVLYLADGGGPTVVLDQAADEISDCWPNIPQEAGIVMPCMNRWMVFPGELRHGMIPVDDSPTSRYVILYNFWSTHRPGPPNCQVPDFSSYKPMSAWSVASRHYLPRATLRRLQRNRKPSDRGGHTAQKVNIEIIENPSELACSSNFGELDVALPMPSRARLLQKRPLRVPWRHLALQATQVLGQDAPGADCGAVPRDLSSRLPLWEHTEYVCED